MNIEEYRNYCMEKKGVTEETPFDNETLVFKVMGKIFALTNMHLFTSVNLKCNPEDAIALREKFDAIIPGYHMNKKHWNTLLLDGTLPEKLIYACIDDSYNLVASGLTKKEKEQLKNL